MEVTIDATAVVLAIVGTFLSVIGVMAAWIFNRMAGDIKEVKETLLEVVKNMERNDTIIINLDKKQSKMECDIEALKRTQLQCGFCNDET
jgi:hypothetical protein